MAGHPQPGVDIAGVVTVDVAKGPAEAIFVRRYCNDVDVIGHQAIRPDRHLRTGCRFGEEIEVQFVVTVLEEGPLASISALGHVVRDTGEHETRAAGHTLVVAEATRII